MLKNKAGQYFHVIAFDENGRVSGDAANITCTLSKDGGTRVSLNDINPEEIEDGEYVFTLTQTETDGHALSFIPKSSTPGVNVLGVPSNVIFTQIIPTLYSGGSGGGELPAVKRPISDENPIWFPWPVDDATITAEKSFNFGSFSNITASITFEEEQAGINFYKLSYHQNDRQGQPGNTRYRLTDDSGRVRYLTLIEEVSSGSGGGDDILSILLNIQDRINFIAPSGFETISNLCGGETSITLVKGDDYKTEDGRQLIWKGKYEDQWPDLTNATVILGIGSTSIVKNCVVINGTGVQEIHAELDKNDTNIPQGTYDYDIQATLVSGNVITLLRSKLQITKSFTD